MPAADHLTLKDVARLTLIDESFLAWMISKEGFPRPLMNYEKPCWSRRAVDEWRQIALSGELLRAPPSFVRLRNGDELVDVEYAIPYLAMYSPRHPLLVELRSASKAGYAFVIVRGDIRHDWVKEVDDEV